ncbi:MULTISPECIES: flagellar export chaperone FliS [Massilia]|jgi:flagellar protein FliS|uniref:Flagellar secretion chaperone FliS n=4 Tax=Massilia TaxID=149698 RepID=A0ABY3ZYK1_9BURK|nr:MULTISPECIES: flagellar export chaperone FliS [Massilia]NHZ38398.1 flagellar export chaperone FliS [Massilia rubra]NHZ40040.1 flagellar export chaperone FliS [Massilia aquatica]NHZ90606.1 flagellar export chaperone FliS [Massilia mucilaginosa]UOD27546.1 flagellar export chaperone FliS [Massilia violaceinigra]
MSYSDAYSDYHSVNLDAQTARASPVELVLLLTDGLLDELARARGHIVGKRYEQKAISIDKCVEIINGLSSSLDFEQGGDVVENLARLYDFCAARLHGAGIKMDPAMLDEVVEILGTIRQGWLGVQARNA